MEDTQQILQQLLRKREWTPEDRLWLQAYLEAGGGEELEALMREQFQAEGKIVDPALRAEMLDNIHERIVYKRRWPYWLAAAAMVTGLLALSVYLFKPAPQPAGMAASQTGATAPVMPGTEKAVLTLADGSSITLDDAANGTLASQGATKVIKLNGKLSYAAAGDGKPLGYNTISTPKGGQYQVELPDGSHVWLNAASSLRFPTAFSGKERRVEISGEAYFEIAQQPAKPFFVKVKDAEVQVLGTHFNVMAYNEEEVVKTTLLEGAVRFVSGNSQHLLAPGQQSQLEKNGQVKISSGVDLSDVIAWKNGVFHFESEDITTVMRQLSRWYDIEIVYENNDVNDRFNADIPRNTTLTDVLRVLELTGKVKFRTEGRKVIVMH